MLTFDFDAESGWLSRDPRLAKRPGVLSQGTYGATVGVPRLLELLAREKVPATFFVPGWVAEQYPQQCRAIRDAGHEIGHHGYLHERADPDDPQAERAAFERGLRALEAQLGLKPAGYRAPGFDVTPLTIELVRARGLLYSSSLMDDAYPYVHPGPGAPVVELPVQWILDDAPYYLMHPRWLPRPIESAEVVYRIWRDEFLGTYEWGGLLNLTCHPQLSGHPSRLLALRKLIRFVKKHRNVWWATGRQVAEHWMTVASSSRDATTDRPRRARLGAVRGRDGGPKPLRRHPSLPPRQVVK
jgi:peptidoglycan/xylan/chitin deacetylase (PgdA/CDA1 family)